MTFDWFLHAGMRTGLTFEEAMSLPFGQLLTIINIDLIAKGAKQGRTDAEEEDDFWRVMALT